MLPTIFHRLESSIMTTVDTIETPQTRDQLPEGWRIVRFDQMADSITERVDNPAEAGVTYYVGLEHLDPESLHIRRWGAPTDVEATKLRFQPGDIIFGRRRAYQRKLAVAEFEGICSAHALVLRAKEETVAKEFLPFFMQSDTFFERAMSISVGSLSPTINWKTLAQQEFAIPPKDEQRRIAEILWAADEAVEKYISVEECLKQAKRAYWSTFLSYGSKSNITLGKVAQITNGSTPSRNVERYWEGGSIPWLPTQKVHDYIIYHADEFVTEAALQECSISLLPANSILIAMIGQGKTRGGVAYLAIDACINQNFACAVPSDEIDSWYLFYCLNNSYDQLRNFSQGTNQGSLNCQLLRRFPIPFVDKEQQLSISKIFRSFDERIQATEDLIVSTKSLYQNVLANLLSH